MELEQLMRFAQAYTKLGWVIQEQVNDIAEGNYDDLNQNAVEEISRTLRGYNEDLDAAIDQALIQPENVRD